MEPSSLERQRAILRFGLFGLLIASPLPFGSVQPLAVLGMELSAACLGAFSIWILRSDEALSARVRRLLVLAGVLLAIGIVQLIPAPSSWTRVVATRTDGARLAVGQLVQDTAGGFAPLSLEAPATIDALLRLAAYVMVGLSAAVAIKKQEHLRQAAVVIAMCGALNALYGSTEYLSGHQHVLWFEKPAGSDEASGTFINRNHFAGYLAMTLPLALGLVLERSRANRGLRRWRDRIVELTEPQGLIVVFGAVAAALIWLAVILSYSRGGLAVALLVTTAVVFSAASGGWRRRFVVVLLALPVAWLLLQEVRTPGERFVAEKDQIASLGGRLPVWKSSLGMIGDYPVLGTGFGTFEYAFAFYRPPEVQDRWVFAHSDWLQVSTEGGLVSAAVVLVALWICVGHRRRPQMMLVTCGTAAIGGVAIHSLIEFGLRIPASAVLFAFLVGATASLSRDSNPTEYKSI